MLFKLSMLSLIFILSAQLIENKYAVENIADKTVTDEFLKDIKTLAFNQNFSGK